MSVIIRSAQSSDAQLILDLITDLARYEREEHSVKVTRADLEQQLSHPNPPFHCLIAEFNGQPAGFALYFYAYSTWEGRQTLYLEDLYVCPNYRQEGIGLALMSRLSQIASENNCQRFEWSVLDWNELAIGFYHRIGAQPVSGWTRFRMNAEAIESLTLMSAKLLDKLTA